MSATRSSAMQWAARYGQHPAFMLVLGYGGAYAPLSISVMPLLLHVWMRQLGASESMVGYLASIASVGGALGLFTSGWAVTRTTPQRTALLGMVVAIACDIASIFTESMANMAIIRFMGGCGAGLSLGVFVGYYARHQQADRCFGLFSLFQFGLPGIVFSLMPSLEARFGLSAIYLTLIVFGLLACFTTPLLTSEIPGTEAAPVNIADARTPLRISCVIVLLVTASVVYNMFAIGLSTYNVLYGLSLGYSKENVEFALATGSASGIIGTVSMIIISNRFGRFRPAIGGLLLFICTIAAVIIIEPSLNFLLFQFNATILAWSFGWPYVQAIQSELDSTGRLAIYGMIATAAGSVAGPAVFASLISGGNFRPAFLFALAASVTCLIMLLAPALRADRLLLARLAARH